MNNAPFTPVRTGNRTNTLVAATATPVTGAAGADTVRICNASSTDVVFVRLDGGVADATDMAVLPGAVEVFSLPTGGGVSLYSAGTPTVYTSFGTGV